MDGALLLLVAFAALGVSQFAERHQIQSSVAVVLVATAASFIPGVPRLELNHETILGIIMPPLIYSAAREFPRSRFRRNFVEIFGLGVTLVVITTFGVAFLSNWLLPTLALSGAFVLAAIVSPPDTVTTVVHGRSFGLTNRCISVLTGESIINDAAALTIFSVSVVAITGDHRFIDQPVLLFLYAAVVGWVVGSVLGILATVFRRAVDDASTATVIGLLLPFAAFMVAEHIHASGVLAVVAAGFTLGGSSIFSESHAVSAETRLQENAVWPALVALLETLSFAYIGLQMRYVVSDLDSLQEPRSRILLATALILAAIMVIRFCLVWLMFSRGGRRLERQSVRHPVSERELAMRQRLVLSKKEMFLVGWTGMRGIVTIGAAASIPLTKSDGSPFPARTEIQTVAYLIAFTSLVVLAGLLPYLARRMDLDIAADIRNEDADLVEARNVANAAVSDWDGPPGDAWFSLQRLALVRAAIGREIDEVAVIRYIDGLDHNEIALERRNRLITATAPDGD